MPKLVANDQGDGVNKTPEVRHNAFQMLRQLSGFIGRGRLSAMLSGFNGKRNYTEIFGWNSTITADNMLYMYNRGGIAKRVVDAYPDAIWARPPVLWVENDDAWTSNWASFAADTNLWTAMYRLDKLARLGHYAVLVIGTDKPGLDTPLTKASKVVYLQPYGETSVKIQAYDRDTTSPTFGRPIMYRIYPEGNGGVSGRAGDSTPMNGPTRSSFLVHASRVVHVATGVLEDDVFGQPIMAPIWDYLTDLRKVIGSSSESYWIAANRGLQANVDKEMSLTAEDQAALQDEIDDFYNGFRRFIRTKGVEMNALQNDLADPMNPFNVLITLIAGTTGIPQRVLVGSEAGQLASTQDKGNWAERIEENRSLHIEPRILKPFVGRMIQMGIIAPPTAGVPQIIWPDAYRMSPLERGQTAAQTGRVLSYVTKLLESKSQDARNLMSRVEMRALLGLSTDNRVLADNPDP